MENILLFCNQAEHFEEALPIGNGHMGALVYGKTNTEKISLNHDTLWSGTKEKRPVPENAPEIFKEIQRLILDKKYIEARELSKNFTSYNTASYLPFGNLLIEFGNKEVTNYRRFLDMESGIACTEYIADSVSHTHEVFASYPHSLVAIKIKTSEKTDFSIDFEHKLKITDSVLDKDTITFSGICPYSVVDFETGKQGYNYQKEDEVVSFTHSITVKTDGMLTFDKKFSIKNSTETIIFVTIDTSECKAERKITDYGKIKTQHIKDFSSLYNKASISLYEKENKLPLDERIKSFDGTDFGLYELLFNFGRYLLISSSREGSEATNLQGIWNEELIAPWRSNYTVNINTEMNYWPVHMANLSSCFEPFISLMKKMQSSGRETAKDYYNAKGFVCHHNTDFFGHTNPVGKGNQWSFIFSFWNMSSGWMAGQLFDEYEYTLDEEKLRDVIYPIMKESADFYIDIMHKDENGKYMVCPSTSPENTFVIDGETVASDKTTMMSVAILFDLFSKLIKVCEILGIDNNYKEYLDNLYIPSVLPDGRLAEWTEDFKESDKEHRHISHLFGLHPGTMITVDETPELAKACENSLNVRGDVGTGWSLAWKVNMWARFKDGNRALKILERQLKYVSPSAEIDYTDGGGTYPNLFDAHPPFQIDGNFGTLSGITEMMLYSRMGYMEILPALPDKFKNGYIKGIKAKGNITVDIFWKNNQATKLSLISPFSQKVTVKVNNEEKIVSLKADKILSLALDK